RNQVGPHGPSINQRFDCGEVRQTVGAILSHVKLCQFFNEVVDCRSDTSLNGFTRERAAKLPQVTQARQNRFSIGKEIYEARHLVYTDLYQLSHELFAVRRRAHQRSMTEIPF